MLTYVEAREAQGEAPEDRRVTPVARNLASHLGVDLANVNGTGRDGRITSEDVQRAAKATSEIAERAQMEGRDEELTSIQRIAAERMTASFQEVPHFYLSVQVDMTESIGMRSQLLPVVEARTGARLSFSDILVLAVSRALREHPGMNASYREGKLRKHHDVNVGLAVDTPQGLVVPVIHKADQHAIENIASRREEAVAKARKNRLSPDDLTGSTFTVSNLGMFGIDIFGAIINPPEAAILAVGRIAERPLVTDNRLAIRPTMWLTLSVDHRVADGASAARFLQTLVSYLEAPYQLVI